jgi:predicted ferric reductase
MGENIKLKYISIAIAIFIMTPYIIFIFQNLPQRTLLKEAISFLVILAFSLVLGLFFLTRINRIFIKIFKMIKIVKIHKIIGYFVIIVFLIHPFLIVLPRYFEAGVNPIDAFIMIITNFNSLGIIFGLISWILIVILLISTFLRNNLTYISWRKLHAVLVVVFVIFSLLHIFDLGRHSNEFMAIFMILLAIIGISLLAKLYFFKRKTKREIQR